MSKSHHAEDRAYININCTPEQKALIEKEARLDNQNISTWCRRVILEHIREIGHGRYLRVQRQAQETGR